LWAVVSVSIYLFMYLFMYFLFFIFYIYIYIFEVDLLPCIYLVLYKYILDTHIYTFDGNIAAWFTYYFVIEYLQLYICKSTIVN